jgi:hypothetical protein
MLNRRVILSVALLALAAVFVWGLAQLFNLRFAAGDIYPEYSSLRADPLGTKAFHDSLAAMDAPAVTRNFRPPQFLPDGRGTTLFVFGLPWDELSSEPSEYKKLDAFVRDGGRLVVTLYPQFPRPRNFGLRGMGTNVSVFKQRAAKAFDTNLVWLDEKWGFVLAHHPVPLGNHGTFQPAAVTTRLPESLPESMSWHSAMVFTNVAADWKVIFARGTNPVMIERRLGSGSIVLATDSYFTSNEALRNERSAKLLAWLAGGNRTVVFDEAHLGSVQDPGVAALARRYRLHGAAIALLCIAGLFVWRNATSFVPAPRESLDEAHVRGRESSAGFINLLRRSVPVDQLLQTCLNEWGKTRALDRRATPQRTRKVRETVEAHNVAVQADPVETYRKISRILNER